MQAYDTGVGPNRHALLPVIGILLAFAAFASCQTTPTGRKQLNFYSLSHEMRIGAQTWEETLSEVPLIESGNDAEMISRIGQAIAKTARKKHPDPAKKFSWEFVLIEDPDTINAWALPGGKCAVYSGLLTVANDEDSLAVIMGHEVAHALLRHGGERLSQGLMFQGALITADKTLERSNPKDRHKIMLALGLGGVLGVLLPYSRSHETEADEVGLLLSAAAGFDPRAAVPLWERMAEASGGSTPTFLSTHPSEKDRIRRLQAITPKALALWQQASARNDESKP